MDLTFLYEIHVQGYLGERWSAWFEGLALTPTPAGETILRGWVADQAALYGILCKIRDLGLPLISVQRLPTTREAAVSS